MIKKHWKKISLLVGVTLAVTLVAFGILLGTGVLHIGEGGVTFNIELFNNLRGTPWLYVVFFVVQVLVTVLLTFMPLGSMLFIVLGIALFGSTWQTFLLVFGGVVTSSLIMDIIGRFGGSRLITKILGQDDYGKALHLLTTKKYTYLPFMYLLPMFPDDALCMVAGMTKINFWYHLTVILLCRGVGTATIIFGINLIPYQNFTTFYEWFVFVGILITYVFLLLKVAGWIDKTLSKAIAKREAKKQQELINTSEGSAGETFNIQLNEKEKTNEDSKRNGRSN